MRFQLVLSLLLVTAFSAAAQAPTRTVIHYPSVLPSAEIHYVDGNTDHYPIMRISKDLIRVDAGNDQSLRMPLTFVESIRFQDGCTLFFENGVFRFDKLVPPAKLVNESGTPVLEGVLALNGQQAESLMGPEAYGGYRKNARGLQAGKIAMITGFAATVPYLGQALYGKLKAGDSSVTTFKEMSTAWKGVTIGGGCLLIGGIVVSLICNSNCNRITASYNEGLGLAYSF